MRTIICSICFIIFICSNVFAEEPLEDHAIFITDKKVTEKLDGLSVTGKMPQVHFVHFDREGESVINTEINERYLNRLEMAETLNATTIDFDYEMLQTGDFLSLVISTEISGDTAKSNIDIININTQTKKMIYITDILGLNGVKIANKVVREELSKLSGIHTSEFSDITNEQDFYIENDAIHLILNENTFVDEEDFHGIKINIGNVINLEIPASMYEIYEASYNLKMIPLRYVLEAFGYEFEWIGSTQTVEIRSADVFYSSIRIGENNYFKNTSPKRQLEAAPALYNDRIFVPISFFEEFLSLLYVVDPDGTVIFSEYTG